MINLPPASGLAGWATYQLVDVYPRDNDPRQDSGMGESDGKTDIMVPLLISQPKEADGGITGCKRFAWNYISVW